MAPRAEVEIGRDLVGAAARGEVVTEARAVGHGATVAGNHAQPLHRPAREFARRQVVDRGLVGERRHQETDQPHVVIERQPARGAVTGREVEPARPDHAGQIGHQGALHDPHAVRVTRAAGRELDVAIILRPERPQVDRLLGQSVDHAHAAVQAHRRELLGGVAEIARQIVDPDGRHRARGRELAAQLVEIGLLAADPDRDRHRYRQQACILSAEEQVEETRPGVGRDKKTVVLGEARADQLAGRHMGPFTDIVPAQRRPDLALGAVNGDAGLALRGIVQHFRHRAEGGAAMGKPGVAGGKGGHREGRLPSRGTPSPQGAALRWWAKLTHPDPGPIVPPPPKPVFGGVFPFGGGLS